MPLAVVGICAAGGWAAFSMSGLGAYGGRLDEELKRARQAGLPLELRELHAIAHVPDADNAAPLYQSAFAKAKAVEAAAPKSSVELEGEFLRFKLTAAERAQLRKHLQAFDPALEVVARATKKKGIDFRRQWELGPDVLFPEPAYIKSAAKRLALRARLAAEGGNTNAAFEDLATIFRMSYQLGEEPVYISMLVAIALQNIAIDAASDIVSTYPSEHNFAAAEALLQQVEVPNFKRGYATEFAIIRGTLKDFAKNPGKYIDTTHGAPSDQWDWIRLSSVRRAVEARIASEMVTTYTEMPDDPNDYKALQAAVDNLDRRLTEGDKITGWYASMLIPFPSGNSVKSLLMRRDLTREAIAALRKLRTAIPQDYTPATMDLYSEKPLKYRKVRNSFRLYSVGEDRTDDEGRLAGEKGIGRDMVFVYPLPPLPDRPPKSTAAPGR